MNNRVLLKNRSKDTKTGNAGRQAAVWFACLILLFLLFFPALEAGHACTHEEECPVCACIQTVQNTVRSLCAGKTVLVGCALALGLFLNVICGFCLMVSAVTPVQLKVRLNP